MFAVKMINRNQNCIKEIVNGCEISIAFDDSCGTMRDMGRADIRIFDASNNDITSEFSDGIIVGDIENLIKVFEWVKAR